MLPHALEQTAEFFNLSKQIKPIQPRCLLKSKASLAKIRTNPTNSLFYPPKIQTKPTALASPRTYRAQSENSAHKLNSPSEHLLRMEHKVLRKIFNF